MNSIKLNNILKKAVVFAVFTIFLAGCSAGVFESNKTYYTAPAEYNIDELNQYGRWVEVPEFGRAWQPSVVQGWQPFYNGHWIYTNNNWTWVSYEPFGWIVYHYGYWYYDDFYGWVWIPKNNGWSPATVRWRQFDDYISWAPLYPPGVSFVEPWEEREARYWHTVDIGSFQKDRVGNFQVSRDKFRNVNNRGTISQPPQPQNPSTPTRTRDNSGERGISNTSPSPGLIQGRTGKPVINVPTTNVPTKTPATILHRTNFPDSERKRIEAHQKEIQKNILVPKKPPVKDNHDDKRNREEDRNKKKIREGLNEQK